jgi:hypothetical protein
MRPRRDFHFFAARTTCGESISFKEGTDMHRSIRSRALFAATAGVLAWSSMASAQVVINEVQYDDSSTDNFEFVELFNSGNSAIDISGWTVGGRDNGTTNPTAVIPGAIASGTTVLAPGAYYVIGNTAVPNVNLVVAANQFENDAETVELRNGPFLTGTLQDSIVYEGNKGTAGHGVLPGDVAADAGATFWGNHQGVDIGTTAVRNSIARHYDGYDTNNNGRNFGNRRATPGANNSSGAISSYLAPNVDAQAVGSDAPGMTGSFVTPRVIDPTVVDTNNLNAIIAPPNSSKAIISWDPSGGGNGASSDAHMQGGGGFNIMAFLDTNDIPINTTSTGTQFRGSEITVYGLGGGDALTNLTDLTGNIQVGAGNISAAGFTGLAWVYEKAGLTGAGGVSELLHLVDANDGGNSNSTHVSGLDWTILATFDMSTRSSNWYNLSVSVDAAGVGTASFDNNVVNFNTAANLAGTFYVGYRENLNLASGASGVPSYVRPATYAPIPEPGTIAGLALAAGALGLRRRK